MASRTKDRSTIVKFVMRDFNWTGDVVDDHSENSV